MVIKGYSTFPKVPALGSHHQIVQVISKILSGVGRALLLCRDAVCVFYSPCELACLCFIILGKQLSLQNLFIMKMIYTQLYGIKYSNPNIFQTGIFDSSMGTLSGTTTLVNLEIMPVVTSYFPEPKNRSFTTACSFLSF